MIFKTSPTKIARLELDSCHPCHDGDAPVSLNSIHGNPFYSHQQYALGLTAMHQLVKSRVFLSGVGGLGVEIAKNLILVGVSSLVLQDNKCTSMKDLGGQFLLTMEDVALKKNRADASCARLAALNPLAKISSISMVFDDLTDLDFLTEFNCVILTEIPLELQVKINKFCRLQNPPIMFVATDVFGTLSCLFCDFGDQFTVLDPTGEEPGDIFISHISKGNPGIVTCADCKLSALDSGDTVEFLGIEGMTFLNQRSTEIKMIDCNSFSICDTSAVEFQEYLGGGIVKKVKSPIKLYFESLADQLYRPLLMTPAQEFSLKYDAAHLAVLALHSFCECRRREPQSWEEEDAEELLEHARQINIQRLSSKFPVDEEMIRKLSFTATGILPPLITLAAGLASQEVLKALTRIYRPLQQWFYLDYTMLVPNQIPKQKSSDNQRYHGIQICIGDEVMSKLFNLHIFIVGSSSISCELLKNCALLGIGTKLGKIVIADDDEKKLNPNQQFLIKTHQLQKLKCASIAEAVRLLNDAVHIEAKQQRISPKTLNTYNSEFFKKQKVILTTLDNMESRRFIDSLCVKYCIPLIDSGTTKSKGHVQVIIPFHTESFACQHDPIEEDIPFCVLKSFPTKIEHTIQWAREKFENFFCTKPTVFNTFWATSKSIKEILEQIELSENQGNISMIISCLRKRPFTWTDCIVLAREQYEKYFNHKAKQLLHSFPHDSTQSDGSLFWQFPKRPPNALVFDTTNFMDMEFITSMAQLSAHRSGIAIKPEELKSDYISNVITSIKIPEFVPHNKQIVTDETANKSNNIDDPDDLFTLTKEVDKLLIAGVQLPDGIKLYPTRFEKDDDSNAQNGFIVSAANLRAKMYGIDVADPMKIKMIAAKLVPALPPTTATSAGFALLELLKLLCEMPNTSYRNCFFNLALPQIVLSYPACARITKVRDLIFSLWDKWQIDGSPEFTLKHLIEKLKIKTGGLEVSMVVDGTTLVYLPMLPDHMRRPDQKMASLLNANNADNYIDLSVTYETDEEDIMGPTVRYYTGQPTLYS